MASVNLEKTVIESAARGFIARSDAFDSFKVIIPRAPVTRGETVNVPFNTGSVSSVFSYSSGYATNTQDVNGKAATMNIHLVQQINLTDADLMKHNNETIANEFASAGEQLAADILSASLASCVTAANYPLSRSYTSANFTSSVALADLKGVSVNWRVSEGKYLLAGPTLVTSLYNNTTYVNAQNIGNVTAVQRGVTEEQDIYGFRLREVGVTLPNSDTGIFLSPNALGVVVGSLTPPPNPTTRYEAITVPGNYNGLTFGYREFYDDKFGTWVRALECLVGCVVLDPTALYHIK